MGKKGVALYFVLAILLVVVILANIILNFITSQARLTTHQVKRVQAYYAAQAGVNLALEKLRLNNATWSTSSTPSDVKTFFICSSAYNAANPGNCVAPNIIEPTFPSSINFVNITIGPLNATFGNRTVNATVNYTSTGS